MQGIKGVDRKAVFPIAYLIHSYLRSHKSPGSATICRDEINFAKAVFFTTGRVSYAPYGLQCINGIVQYDGNSSFQYPHDDLFTFLVNAIIQLKPGFLIKVPI